MYLTDQVRDTLLKKNDIYISENTVIKQFENSVFGSHISIDDFTYISTKVNIGDYTHIASNVTIIGGKDGELICKGFNNIMCGARIICGSDRFDGSGLFGALIPDELKGSQIIKPIIMDEFSNVGTNAVIMPGSILRQGVLVTIGSVLFGDTEPWGVYSGNPAKLVKKIDGTKIIDNANKLSNNFKLKK